MHGWRNVSPQDSSAAASESEPLLRTSAAAAPAAGHKAQQLAWQDVEQGQATAAAAQQASEAKGLLRTAIVVATCLAWVCVSSVAILINKHVMVDVGFKYPTTVAFLGLVTTTVLSYASLQLLPLDPQQRTPISARYFLYNVMPTGFMMALTFQCGNGAYLHLTVAFVQMLKAFCPVITMLLLFAARLERPTPRLIASILLISLGVSMASYGEMNMSFVGLTLMLTSVVSESMRLVMTQHLLVRQTMHPMEGLFYISSACSLCLMLLAGVFEWQHLLATAAYALALQHPFKFAAAALAGFGVNTLAILVIKLSSSLTLKVLGTVKDAALVTIGVVFLREVVSSLQLSGYLLSLVGFVAYNAIKAQGAQLPDPMLKAK